MKLFFIFFVILLMFFIPIPIKINIYYSAINYYIKLYGFTIISQKKSEHKKKIIHNTKFKIKNNSNTLKRFYKNIDFKADFKSLNYRFLISQLYNSKFKPSLKIDLFCNYSLNDASRTAIFYGVLCQTPPLIYLLLNILFNINKFNININPIFEDKFLLKIEISSIFFLSFANAMYIMIILFKSIKKRGR